MLSNSCTSPPCDSVWDQLILGSNSFSNGKMAKKAVCVCLYLVRHQLEGPSHMSLVRFLPVKWDFFLATAACWSIPSVSVNHLETFFTDVKMKKHFNMYFFNLLLFSTVR